MGFIGIVDFLPGFTPFQAKGDLVGSWPVKEIWLKANTMFIKGDSMSKGFDVSVERSEWKTFRDEANGSDGIPVSDGCHSS